MGPDTTGFGALLTLLANNYSTLGDKTKHAVELLHRVRNNKLDLALTTTAAAAAATLYTYLPAYLPPAYVPLISPFVTLPFLRDGLLCLAVYLLSGLVATCSGITRGTATLTNVTPNQILTATATCLPNGNLSF
jgi:hypothetical protein